jgi:hypothetical protein
VIGREDYKNENAERNVGDVQQQQQQQQKRRRRNLSYVQTVLKTCDEKSEITQFSVTIPMIFRMLLNWGRLSL